MADKDNSGFPGYTISQIRGVAAGGLALKPNVVLIHAGTNDLNRGNNPPEPDNQAPARLGGLIDDVLKAVPNALVLVAKITPSSTASLNAKFTTFNNAIPGIVASRVSAGKSVAVVDQSVLSTSSQLSDYLHP